MYTNLLQSRHFLRHKNECQCFFVFLLHKPLLENHYFSGKSILKRRPKTQIRARIRLLFPSNLTSQCVEIISNKISKTFITIITHSTRLKNVLSALEYTVHVVQALRAWKPAIARQQSQIMLNLWISEAYSLILHKSCWKPLQFHLKFSQRTVIQFLKNYGITKHARFDCMVCKCIVYGTFKIKQNA